MILARIKTWLAIAGAMIVAIGVALIYGMYRGRQYAADKIKAVKRKVADAEATIHAHEVSDHVEQTVNQTPDAPPQKVADADPDTAAGHLRDVGWMRDDRAR